jgi:hypothetical protein
MKPITAYQTLNGKRFTSAGTALLEEVKYLAGEFDISIVPVHGSDAFIDNWFDAKRSALEAIYAKVQEYRQQHQPRIGNVVELKQAA